MSQLFRDQQLTLTCGQCGHQSKETVARLETSPDVTCPRCGVVTHYDGRQLKAKLGEVDKAIEKLGQTLKKAPKR